MREYCFISHSTPDAAKATAVCEGLERSGISCWIAPRDVRPGRSFAGEITRAIKGSGSMVLLLTKASNESHYVLREVERAIAEHISIFVLRLDDTQLSDDLELLISIPQWIDASRVPLAGATAILAEALRDHSGETGPRRPEPRVPVRPARRFRSLFRLCAICCVVVLGAVGAYLYGTAWMRERRAASGTAEAAYHLLSREDPKGAERMARAAIRRNDRSSAAHAVLAAALAVEDFSADHKPPRDEIRREADLALALDPGSGLAHSALAEYYVLTPNGLPLAHREAMMGLRSDRLTRPFAYNAWGLVLLHEHQPAQAAGAFREAIRLDSEIGWAHDNLYWALQPMDRRAEKLKGSKLRQ